VLEFRQLRQDGISYSSAMAALTFAVGTSIALPGPLPPRFIQPEYNFESAISPIARELKREMALLQSSLLAHNTEVDDYTEVVEAYIDRSYISRATVTAAIAPDVSLHTDEYTALMAVPTYFPRLLDIDYDED
jgi:hypothetical protein